MRFLKSKSYFSAQILPNLIFSRLEFHCELKYWMFVKGRLRHIFYIDIDIECLRHIFWQVLHSTANIANFVPFVNFQLILSNADVHSSNQNSFWEGKRKHLRTWEITSYSLLFQKESSFADVANFSCLLTFVVNFGILSTLSVTNIIRESMLFHNWALCQMFIFFIN